MKWSKILPRESGWFWIRDKQYGEWVGDIENRNNNDDGWLWTGGGGRIYLTPNIRGEDDEHQDETWMTWEWAGPIPAPSEPIKGKS